MYSPSVQAHAAIIPPRYTKLAQLASRLVTLLMVIITKSGAPPPATHATLPPPAPSEQLTPRAPLLAACLLLAGRLLDTADRLGAVLALLDLLAGLGDAGLHAVLRGKNKRSNWALARNAGICCFTQGDGMEYGCMLYTKHAVHLGRMTDAKAMQCNPITVNAGNVRATLAFRRDQMPRGMHSCMP